MKTAVLLSALLACAAIAGADDVLHLVPTALHWDEVRPGESYEDTVLISNSGPIGIHLYYIFAECDCTLRHPLEGFVPAGGTFALPILIEIPENADDDIEERIEMLTDLTGQPSLLLPVSARIARGDAPADSLPPPPPEKQIPPR